jgi:hypothetical protein
MGPHGLYLNRWTHDFYPEVDVPKAVPVWVRLPNLPIHCWNPSSLQTIGNKMGRFIDKADPKGQYSCAWICKSREGWQQEKIPKANPNPNSKKVRKNKKGQNNMENSFAILGNQENELVSNENIAENQDKSEAASQENKESPP